MLTNYWCYIGTLAHIRSSDSNQTKINQISKLNDPLGVDKPVI